MFSLSNEELKNQLGNKDTTKLNANDNKIQKEIEVCNCSIVQGKPANSGLVCDKCESEEEQKLKSNSKEDKLKLGIGKEVEEEQAIDSGFMSELNLSSRLAFEEEEEEKINLEAEDDKNVSVAAKSDVEGKEVIKEQQNNKVGASAKSRKNSSDDRQTVDEMRLKNDMDSGISESFWSQNQNGAGINNLSSTQRRSNANVSVTQSSPALPQASQKFRIMAGWEKYYQQNSEGDTALHLACLAGAENVVIELLRLAIHPCLYNIQNDDAQTPMHMAALCAHAKILRLLLIMGAEPTIRDRYGNTALHVAVDTGDEQCVRALLSPLSPAEIKEGLLLCSPRLYDKKLILHLKRNPMDLEIRNYDGERYVHLAAQEGRINLLRMLVQYGADINAREGKSGRTPLHIAIESCNEALLNFLLEECHKELNLETETYGGLTAYQFACLLDKEQLTHMLKKSGAEPLTPPMSDYENSDGEDLDESKVFGDYNIFAGHSGRKTLGVA